MCDVLILENEALIRMVLAEDLDDNGFDVHEAYDIFEAMRVVAASSGVKVIVADQELPDGNGHDYAAKVLAAAGTQAVVYISGRGDVLNARKLGHNECALLKPFLPSKLLAMVQGLLAVRGAHGHA